MNNYEMLLEEAEQRGLITKEINLLGHDGRIKGNRIAIRRGMTTVKKSCVMAEELGHYYTSTGNILDQTKYENVRQERRARLWAYNKKIGLTGIVDAYKYGCRNLYEMAEYLEVTEEFLKEALDMYYSKYGLYTTVDNYIIYFEPSLTVADMNFI